MAELNFVQINIWQHRAKKSKTHSARAEQESAKQSRATEGYVSRAEQGGGIFVQSNI